MDFLSQIRDIILCILVRVFLMIQIGFVVYLLTDFLNNFAYLSMILCFFCVLADTTFAILLRRGLEYKWFSISCFSYSTAMVILIWHLVFLKLDIYQNNYCPSDDGFNETVKDDIVSEFWLFKSLDICQLMEISVALYILTCCFTKWASPMKQKDLKNKAFLNVLISYITNGADIVDFFAQLDDVAVVISLNLTLAILIFFTLSSLQFSFGLSATLNRTKKRVNRLKSLLFGTEIWALLIVLLFQDLPFTILRITILVYYQQLSKNYTLYFFVAKNLILASYGIYLISLILYEEKFRYHKTTTTDSTSITTQQNHDNLYKPRFINEHVTAF